MQRNSSLQVALKERPKPFRFIVICLFSFSLANTAFTAVLLVKEKTESSKKIQQSASYLQTGIQPPTMSSVLHR
jgi:hypothetical protein